MTVMARDWYEACMKHKCETCKAEIGQPCYTKNNHVAPWAHSPRIKAAKFVRRYSND